MIKTIQSENQCQPPPSWCGVLTLGSVNLPVSLLHAGRGKPIAFNRIEGQGNQLRPPYFREKEHHLPERAKPARDHLAGNNQFSAGEYENRKSLIFGNNGEIALRRFALLDEIDPTFFNFDHFLVADSGSNKAYQLLVQSMAEEGRVGIATLVIKDRECLIAITAEQGHLKAEFLRFHDEFQPLLHAELYEHTGSEDLAPLPLE